MNWTTTKLIAIGALSALIVVMQLPGSTIATVLGMPGVEGLIESFIFPIPFIVLLLVVRNFGRATLSGLITGFLMLPLTMYGPPGFLLKIPASVISGFIVDVSFYFLRRSEKLAAIVAGGIVGNFAAAILIMVALLLFPVEGAFAGFEEFRSAIGVLSIAVVSGLLCAAGGFIGYLLYKRVENTAVVKRIQRG